jgi:hypothetical protein
VAFSFRGKGITADAKNRPQISPRAVSLMNTRQLLRVVLRDSLNRVNPLQRPADAGWRGSHKIKVEKLAASCHQSEQAR